MTSPSAPVTQVAAAVIRHKDRYLIGRRSEESVLGGLWEFPGGKCAPGEEIEDCLRRELEEELGEKLGRAVTVGQPVCEVLYPYPHGTVLLYFYNCSLEAAPESDAPKPLGGREFRWVRPQELPDYPFPPANQLLIQQLQESPPKITS